jgi:hypothetical protein
MRLKLRYGYAVTFVTILALVASVPAEAASSAPTLASTMTDSRIDESSSLALSAQNSGLAYTANDENDPVYAVEISTGRVVGAARVMTPSYGTQEVRVWKCRKSAKVCDPAITCKKKARKKKCKRVTQKVAVVTGYDEATLGDPEAMAMDSAGVLWLADLGDNDLERDGGALYAFAEPGAGDHEVFATRYPIAYPGGASFNVETLLINPITNAKFLVTKSLDGSAGRLFALPASLSPTTPNVAVDLGKPMPTMVSDGDFSPRGTRVILRDGTRDSTVAHVYNPSTWTKLGTIRLPELEGKGEAVSFDQRGPRFLTSREGDDSPLYWVPFDESTWTSSTQ